MLWWSNGIPGGPQNRRKTQGCRTSWPNKDGKFLPLSLYHSTLEANLLHFFIKCKRIHLHPVYLDSPSHLPGLRSICRQSRSVDMAGTSRDEETITSPNESTPNEDTPLLKPPNEENWTPPRHFLLIELAIFANVFLYGFDGTITAATYAVISSEFDAANTASWLTTSYLVTSTAFQPLYGRFSDIFGRRICFFVSTVTFAAGCLGSGLAGNVVLVNVMRALTGFGGGGLMTMGR